MTDWLYTVFAYLGLVVYTFCCCVMLTVVIFGGSVNVTIGVGDKHQTILLALNIALSLSLPAWYIVKYL